MSIKTTADKIEQYKALYLEGMNKLTEAQKSEELNDKGKSLRMAAIRERYTPAVEQAAERVLAEIENTKGEIRAERQKALTKGLENAEAVSLVKKGISSGDYTVSMIADLIESYKNEPIMREAIRGAVKASDNAEIVELAESIPEDMTDRQIERLDKTAARIKAAPKFAAENAVGDLTVTFWQNGAGIDSLVSYLLGLEGTEDMNSEQAEEQENTDELSRIFNNNNIGIKFGE